MSAAGGASTQAFGGTRRLSFLAGLVCRRTLLPGRGWQAMAVTRSLRSGAGFARAGRSEFAATWLSCEVPLAGRSIFNLAAFQPNPHGEMSGVRSIEERSGSLRRTTAAHGAADLGGTRHGGGPGAARNERRTERHDARTGVDGASPTRMTSNPHCSQPASHSKSEARMGHP